MAASSAPCLAFSQRSPDAAQQVRPDGRIAVEDGCVHVWQLALEATDAELSRCRDLLSETETARAARFHRDDDRHRYIVAHGLLRDLLSRYCGIPAERLEFATDRGGKPMLRSAHHPPLSFNLSHSAGRMLVAIAGGRAVGVDIEAPNRRIDPLKLARRYFSGPEVEDIEAAPDGERHARFVQYWVAKEATVKAAGLGLDYPLDALRVHFSAKRDVARIESLQPERLAADWTVRMVPCDPGWHGAVVSRGDQWTMRRLHGYAPTASTAAGGGDGTACDASSS
jgi:4'-phosphopantetheinyl transferase